MDPNEAVIINKTRVVSEFRCTQQFVSLKKTAKLQILIIRNLFNHDINDHIIKIIKLSQMIQVSILNLYGCTIHLEEQNYHQIMNLVENVPLLTQILKPYSLDFEHQIDLLITIGGDGTILYAMKHFQNRASPPTLCFERGSLGFMCNFNLEQLDSRIQKTMSMIQDSKDFVIEQKERIYGRLITADQDHGYHVMNEFVITRGGNPHVLRLNIFINDIFLTEVQGDGLIISTPNGSTAYSLSAGGPIVQNEVGSIIIVPICPLSLSFRPLVLPMCMKIEIKLSVESRGTAVILADGQVSFPLEKNQQFVITHSTQNVKLIVRQEQIQFSDWVNKLKLMLNWNNKYTSSPKEIIDEEIKNKLILQKL